MKTEIWTARILTTVILLAALVTLIAFAHGGQPSAAAQARARAALALATASKPMQAPRPPQAPAVRDCGCGGVDRPCPCGPGCTCGVRAKNPINPIENLTYELAYLRAIRQGKPLLVWVGETCPACEASWAEYVHTRCTRYERADGSIEAGPSVMVCKPDGLGGMDLLSVLPGVPTQAQVQGVLSPRVAVAPPMMPPPMPMMPPPMMGGFGGFGGFGGGGGGCGG